MPSHNPQDWTPPTGLSVFSPAADIEFRRVVSAVYRERAILENKLTEEQFVEAMRQAVACGDFMRYLTVGDTSLVDTTITHKHKQAVTYEPYREVERLKARIRELELELELASAEHAAQYPGDEA